MRSHGESIPAHVYVLHFKCGDRCRVAGHSFAGIEPLDEWPNVKVSRTLGYGSSHVITTCALYVRVGLGRSVLGEALCVPAEEEAERPAVTPGVGPPSP